ncbi:MAG: trigger factor [Pseudomonadales bacterium]
MQVSVETIGGLERRLTIGIPVEKIDTEVNARLQKAAPNVRLAGFRPGKVPLKVVRQRFGAGVRQEVLGELMNQTFYEAVEQEDIKPAGRPNIATKTDEQGFDFEYTATFEVYPEIGLTDLSQFKVTRAVAEVTDEDVDDTILKLREQHGEWEPVERAAQEGDQVVIDYNGTKDGEPFDGGAAENSSLDLGSKRMIPGFEDGIAGMQVGDEKTLELSFPEDYHAEELKGAAVEFKVKLNEVREHHAAELDDALFEKLGVTEGGEEQFRKEVRENMDRELASAITANVKSQVMEALINAHDVQIPAALLSGEIDTLRQQSLQQFGAAAEQFDASLLPDELFNEQAQRRVKLGLILGEVIKQKDIKPNAEKVRTMIEDMAATYESPEEVINWHYSDQERLASVEAAALEEQVVDEILEVATVDEKSCSYQEALQAQQQQ